jgi:hypothetical protein
VTLSCDPMSSKDHRPAPQLPSGKGAALGALQLEVRRGLAP